MSFSSDVRCRLYLSVKRRLPGTNLFDALSPRRWDFRYGPRVIALRMLRPVFVYCLGGRCIGKSRPVAKLTRDYPLLYHFSPAFNRESILEKGLLPSNGRVWLTDWQDAKWLMHLQAHRHFEKSICLRVNAERLIASGHTVFIMDNFHEYTTDYVPPDCLTLVETRAEGNHLP